MRIYNRLKLTVVKLKKGRYLIVGTFFVIGSIMLTYFLGNIILYFLSLIPEGGFSSPQEMFIEILSHGTIAEKVFLGFNILILISMIALSTLIVDENTKKIVFPYNFPNLRKQLKKLKITIKETLLRIVDFEDEKNINERDRIYGNLLKHMQAEFKLDGVDIKTIEHCIRSLEDEVINKGKAKNFFALTDFDGHAWLTRTMLFYLIRTIQVAGGISNQNEKLRVFLVNDDYDEDEEAFKSVCSLHNGFLPYKISKRSEVLTLDINKNIKEKPAFLFIEFESKKLFWHIYHGDRGLLWMPGSISDDYEKILNFYKTID